MKKAAKVPTPNFATRADVVRLCGDLDDNVIVAVLDLSPTLAELEEAAVWLDGQDPLVAGRGHPQTPRVAQILELVDRDDEEPSYLR